MADGGAVEAESPATVPSDATAVDVPCPHCGRRPIETVAKGYRVTGMILVMQYKSLRFVGCQSCIRRKLWWATVKNVFLGWWSIKSAVMNPFAIGWNVFRSFVSRGPNENLVAALEESGIPFQFIDDKNSFDPAAHHDDELLVDGMLKLATALMLADGEVEEPEVQAALETVEEMFDDYERAELEARLQSFAREGGVDVGRVSSGLSTMLTGEGKQLVMLFAMQVAGAGTGVEPDEREMDLLAEIAENLGLSEQQMEELLSE